MSQHVVKVLEAAYINADVKRFVVHKPSGYSFTPGQATELAINRPEWDTKFRPFTFTSLNKWEHLEFLVRIYKGHKGVTQMLSRINAGDEFLIKEPFGAIQYKGPGVFIAGGTGITPFISIFRELNKNKQLTGNKLIYSNYGSQDVICGAELHDMLKEHYINHYTREGFIGYKERRINTDFLVKYISDFSQLFYLCGSASFVSDLSNMLTELGAKTNSLVIEH